MVDSARELRAAILVATPYPPLPVNLSKVEPGSMVTSGDDTLVTTHTLLAKCIDFVTQRNDPAQNARRLARQQDVFRRFLLAMGERGFDFEPPDLYTLYASFTREHLATYFPDGTPLDIKILPYDHMCPGDKAHAKLVEYVCAQSILFEDPVPLRPANLKTTPLADLLKITRDRVGHVASQEERAKIRVNEDREAALASQLTGAVQQSHVTRPNAGRSDSRAGAGDVPANSPRSVDAWST